MATVVPAVLGTEGRENRGSANAAPVEICRQLTDPFCRGRQI